MKRWRYGQPTWFVVPTILLFWLLALNSMVGDSPTMDEQNHLARGLAFLRTGDPRLSLEHPPLVNAISAFPLLTLPDIRLPTDHPSWERPEGWYEFADLLLWRYNADVTRMIFLARLPIVFLLLGLGALAYRVARRFWGRWSALAALAFILFDPNLLAHGRYTTTDLGGAFFLFLAAYALWRMWSADGWNWRRLGETAVALGLAFGSKLSTLGFVPIFGAMALLPLYSEKSWRSALRRLVQLGTAGLLSTLVLWAIFGFEWANFYFRDEALTFLNAYAGPMPTFWAGVEQILRFSQGGRGSAFLLGEFSEIGFSLYFPIAFLFKTPLPLLILLSAAIVLLVKERATRAKALFLLLPAAIYFAISAQSALNIGYRHLLPMIPFLWVLISGWAGEQVSRWAGGRGLRITDYGLRFMVYVFLVALLIADFAIHPHYLSYFNFLAGGPENGYKALVDSNVDWGQDLLRLQDWMAENDVPSVKLAWFGSADPAYYAIPHEPLPGIGRGEFHRLWWDVPFNRDAPESGVYAISVTNLWELPLREGEKTVFAYFRDREPDALVGYSILIYRVP
ncbi:MAG: hypothetical protein GY803_16010 [Chloroflexi bacterium]|nr:hypothetical protein [Chloroflexota bacterium]